MRRVKAKWLAVLFLVPLVGCGEEAASPSGQAAPASLLIQESDLPPDAKAGDPIPEPCSPVPLMEEQNASTVVSSLFNLGRATVAEAVGVAPSEGEAESVLDSLQDEERMVCIQGVMENFGPGDGVSVELTTPVPRSEGDEGSLVRLTEVDQASEPVNSATIVSFRSGRCVASLLFVLKGGEPKEALIDRLSGRAEERLADANSNCR